MALHGNLQVNGVTVGLYSVKRTDWPHAFKGWYLYEWEYVRASNLSHRYTGIVTHRHDDGAERLLEKVLAAARKAIKLDSK